MKRNFKPVAGFTLMEINLVLFLFGAGITAMLGIFPVGLRQAQYALSDTIQVAFATKVLSSLESKAEEMCAPQYSDCWKSLAKFKQEILKDVAVNDDDSVHIIDTKGTPYEKKGVLIERYLSDGAPVRYCLEIVQLEYDANKGMLPYLYADGVRKPPPRYRAALWVVDMKSGQPKKTKPYVADFQYREDPDPDPAVQPEGN